MGSTQNPYAHLAFFLTMVIDALAEMIVGPHDVPVLRIVAARMTQEVCVSPSNFDHPSNWQSQMKTERKEWGE